MVRTRIIPALLLKNESLVKTVNFKNFKYVGDPANTVRIFNELAVDELLFLDISASIENRNPNYEVLSGIANECFMPLGYGGGIKCIEEARKIFEIGFEKIAINSNALINPNLISEIANLYGSQAVICSIDVKIDFFGNKTVRSFGGRKNTKKDPVNWAREVENMGAGEILLTSIDKEGTWEGFDLELKENVSSAVSIPVIAHGGAGNLNHIKTAISQTSVSAIALGSMVVFQKKGMGVLVNFPEQNELKKILS